MSECAGGGQAIRIAVSACLLGEGVRYDGGHRRSRYAAEALGAAFRLLPECPEVGIGLGVPRPKIRLEDMEGGIRLVGSDGRDLTPAMTAYARQAARRFREAGVAGIVLKARSPSCGMGDARLHRNGAALSETGDGVFAGSLAAALAGPPRISEADLEDPARRDHWLTRVFGCAGLLGLDRRRGAGIADFHARWRTLVTAHSETAVRRLDTLLARPSEPSQALADYRRWFSAALAAPPSAESHQAALRRFAGRLAGRLAPSERRQLDAAITAFGQRRLPLAVPVRRIAALARRLRIADLAGQAYLESPPAVLRYREDIYRESPEGTPPLGLGKGKWRERG